MTNPRIPCAVPGCGRTTPAPAVEWVCSDHWRAIPNAMRRVWARLRRAVRKNDPGVSYAGYVRLWNRLKRAAIERAGGIG